MKGSLEGVLPMIGLLIISALLAMQTLPIAGSLNSLASESAEDLGNLAETRTGYDSFERYYADDSAKYSVNNAAWHTINSVDNWESLSQTANTEQDIFETFMEDWESEANSRFNSRLDDFQCSVNDRPNFEVYPDRDYSDLFDTGSRFARTEVTSTGEIRVSCNDATAYVSEEFEKVSVVDNNFVDLAATASIFFYQLNEVYSDAESEVQNVYEAEDAKCGEEFDGEPTADEVEEDYNEDTPDIEDDILSEIEYQDWLSVSADASDHPDAEVTDAGATDEVCEEGGCDTYYSCSSFDGLPNQCSQHNCAVVPEDDFACVEKDDEKPLCKIEEDDKYWHNQTATLEPEKTEIGFEAIDYNTETIADGEGKYLEITVNNFEYEWN